MSDSLRPHGVYIVHGILQARILEWVAFPFSRGSSQLSDRTQVSHITSGFFIIWAPREALLEEWKHSNTDFFKKCVYLFGCTRSFLRRRQWHPAPVLLPRKSHGRRAWWSAVHGVAKSGTRLSDFTFTFHFHALEKQMATHSSVLAWRIPGTGEPGRLLSLGLHSVGHDWSDLAAAAAGLLCGMRGLWVVAYKLLVVACGI